MTKIKEIFNFIDDDGKKTSFGVDGNNNLYVGEKKVVTEKRVVLDKWVNISIVASGISAVIISVLEIYKFL
jgi:hypothetical protein